MYAHFLRKILNHKARQTYSQMLNRVIVVHDNTRPHIATSVTTVFQEYDWEVLNHTLYSPDLSPLNYNLFPKRKEPLQGIRFSDLIELSSAMTWENQWLNKNQLLHRIERLLECWRACISHERITKGL